MDGAKVAVVNLVHGQDYYCKYSSFCILLRARMTKANNIGLDTFDDDDWSCHSLSQSPAHSGPINMKIVKNILIPPEIHLFS